MTRVEWELKNNYWKSQSCKTCKHYQYVEATFDSDEDFIQCNLMADENMEPYTTEDFVCDRWDG